MNTRASLRAINFPCTQTEIIKNIIVNNQNDRNMYYVVTNLLQFHSKTKLNVYAITDKLTKFNLGFVNFTIYPETFLHFY